MAEYTHSYDGHLEGERPTRLNIALRSLQRIKDELGVLYRGSRGWSASERAEFDSAMRQGDCVGDDGSFEVRVFHGYRKPQQSAAQLGLASTRTRSTNGANVAPEPEAVTSNEAVTMADAQIASGKLLPIPDGTLKTDKPSQPPGRGASAPCEQRASHTKFQDPFIASDRHRGRRGGPPPYESIEYTWTHDGLPPTPLATAIRRVVDLLKVTKLTPRDIDGAMFRSMSKTESEMLAGNWNVVSAHIFAKLYDEKYKNYHHSLKTLTNMDKLKSGVVLSCPITERLMDTNVPIDDLSRSHGVDGSTVTKTRTCIVTQVKDQIDRIELRPGSSFHGNGPKIAHKEHYARLIHSDATTKKVDPSGYRLFHFAGGDNHLTERTYFRLGESHWTGISNTPASTHGHLTDDDFDALQVVSGLNAETK